MGPKQNYGKRKEFMTEHFVFPEGATPILDCSGLIPNWVHHINDLNRVEAENIAVALRKYLRKPIDSQKNWFHETELKNIHQTMFGNVWTWAGKYRKSVTSIGIQPSSISSQLGEFCLEVRSWFCSPVELTFVEMAARIHHRLVFIHPFENGNGRFSRLIADRFLLAFKCPYPSWPNSLNKEGILRKDYIQSLKNADRGNYVPLITIMNKLGAKDPTLGELFKNDFYVTYLKSEQGISLVKSLLRNGCDPNVKTTSGDCSLHLAMKAQLDEIVKLLVLAGADVNFKDRSGLTPLQLTVRNENKPLADFLISKGAKG